MRKPAFCLCCDVTAKLISAFAVTTRIMQFLFTAQNLKLLASLLDCTGQSVPDLLRNPKDQLS